MSTTPNDNKGPSKEETAAYKALLAFDEERKNSLEYQRENLAKIRLEIKEQAKTYKGLVDQQIESLKVDEQKVKTLRDLAGLYGAEMQVVDDLLLKRNMISTGLKGEYAQLLTTYMLENDITDIGGEQVQNLIKQLKHREEIKDQLDKELELVEGLAKYQLEVREEAEKLRKEYGLLGAKIKAIFTDKEFQKAFLKGLAIEKAIEQVKELGETFGEFRKEGLTMTQAFSETGVAVGAMFSLSGASLKENQELMAGFAHSMGDSTKFTKDTVVEVGKLAKTLGIGMEEAGKIQGQLQNMAGATAESATNTMEFAGALAKAAHVAPGAVMKDMAQNAEDIAINTKNGGKDMAVVSVAAHKLGVEMSTLTKMSAGLLDFENSINKQMEASVLLGREINLDKARELALNGDILGATQEMLKNVGGEAEFNKMNVIQRKALADSMGVSVSDLSKMVKNQDQLANLTEEQNQALADGSMTMDEVLANSGGVAKNLYNGALSIAGSVVSAGAMAKGLKDSLGITKDLVKGIGGMFSGLKKGASGAQDLAKQVASMKAATPGLTSKDALAQIKGAKIPKVDDISGAADKTKNVKAEAGTGIKGFLTGLGDGLASIGRQFPDVVAGAAALALAGLALAGGFALALYIVKDVDPVVMLAFAGSIGIFGVTLALMGKTKGSILQGAFALGVIAIAMIPFAFAMQKLIGLDIKQVLAAGAGMAIFAGVIVGLGALMGTGFGATAIPLGAAALVIIGLAIYAFAERLSFFSKQKDGLAALHDLATLATQFSGLREVSTGLDMITTTLGKMSNATPPVIDKLLQLAATAPSFEKIGAALNGIGQGGGEKKEDKLETTLTSLQAAINNLVVFIKTPASVNMDGKKVGDVLRLASSAR